MQRLPSLAVLAAALALSTPASAALAPAYSVEPVLSRVAGVETRCFAEWPWQDVVGQYASYDPWDDTRRRSIWLAPAMCKSILETLARRSTNPWTVLRRAVAWHVFAHEVAHHLGYDHGETTVGADCIGERIDFRLMVAAGVPVAYARRIDEARTLPCVRTAIHDQTSTKPT